MWVSIKENNNYILSDLGEIKKKDGNKIYIRKTKKHPFIRIKHKDYYIHQLVAKYFLPVLSIEKGQRIIIMHKDNNPNNNDKNNLIQKIIKTNISCSKNLLPNNNTYKCECGIIGKNNFYPNNTKTCKNCVKKRYMEWKEKNKLAYMFTQDNFASLRPLYAKLQNAKHRATRKKIEFNLTEQDILSQLLKQKYICYFSGEKLDENNLSIDRIDSTKGYTPDNIELTTKRINWMKGNLSNKKFINIINTIYLHSNSAHS